MSKAFILIDMPDTCRECPYITYRDSQTPVCSRKHRSVLKYYNRRADWCPLIPVPEKQSGPDNMDFDGGFTKGWNACVDSLTGK